LAYKYGRFQGLEDSAGPERVNPTDGDGRDPLNWTQWKKNSFLLIISIISFLADFGTSTGSITLLPQSAQWRPPLSTINHTLIGNQFMIGAGGLVVVTLSAYFGRLPVLFYFLTLAVAMAAWCGAATNFQSFMTARILNGFFSTVAQAGGLMWIKDMYFPHEHARKINI
jgi:MFS family permease